jgi:hypothetical protein
MGNHKRTHKKTSLTVALWATSGQKLVRITRKTNLPLENGASTDAPLIKNLMSKSKKDGYSIGQMKYFMV